MVSINKENSSLFANDFLKHYLSSGLAAMPKSEIDALVMHLIDKYTTNNDIHLQTITNQSASEILRTPISKIKKLRYDAGLKYGLHVEEEGRKRFINCLIKSNFDIESDNIIILIEDILAKHWIQGRIKSEGILYDGSFNSEILKIKSKDFLKLIKTLNFQEDSYDNFNKKYHKLLSEKKSKEITTFLQELLKELSSSTIVNIATKTLGTMVELTTS